MWTFFEPILSPNSTARSMLHVVCGKSPCTLLWRCDACNVKLGNVDKSHRTKLETVTIFLLNRRTLVLLAYLERRR
jgi:hypothetical protein